jgi:GNAT superfamily N-acetyltransferase
LAGVEIREGARKDSDQFIRLVRALARFERLRPPSKRAADRLVADVFDRKRVNLVVAEEGGGLVGYALYFFSYSSFLARPTLYLEDIFVSGRSRKLGVGRSLFERCVQIARESGCGRMEWAVLKWNEPAMKFYSGLGAKSLDDWSLFRLDREAMKGHKSRGRQRSAIPVRGT